MEDILVSQKPVKRGRPRKAIKKEIEVEEEIVYVPRLSKHISFYKRTSLNIEDIIPNVIEGYGMYKNPDNCGIMVILPVDATTLAFKNWRLGRGGVLLRDAKRFYNHNDTKAKYVLLENDTEKAIIRLVTDETELGAFKAMDILDQCDSDYYVMIKLLSPTDDLTQFFSSMDDAKKIISIEVKNKEEEDKEEEEDNLYNNVISSEDDDQDDQDDITNDDTDIEF